MRVVVLALAAICVAEPAFARERAHQRSQPATPEAFSRTDAWQTPSAWQQQNNWQGQASQDFAGYNGETRTRTRRAAVVRNTALDGAIARHAAANGLPVELVHRVVKRESNYNPRAHAKGNIGLMQIRYQTARGIGYTGSASGLLDAETNLTYAVRYLAGAYRAAGGSHSRAVSLYASGYHGRGMRTARAPRTLQWGWETQQSPQWQSAQVAMRGDAMTAPGDATLETASRYRIRHRHRR